MKRTRPLFALVLGTLACSVSVAAEARADAKAAAPNVDDARLHFQQGVDLYRESSFDAALAEFQKAYDLAPNYRVLFNLAQVQNERHDYGAALQLFEKYLAQGGSEVPADRKEQVEHEIVSLKARVAELSVTADVSDAELLVDGVVVGVLPLKEPVIVSSGVRRIEVRKSGYMPSTRTESVAGGDALHFDVKLDPLGAATPSPGPRAPLAAGPSGPAPADQAPAEKPSHSRAPMWVTLVSTSLLAGGAVTFGVLTEKSNKSLDQELNRIPADKEAIDGARSDLKRNALLTDVFSAAAVVSGGAFLYFALSGSSSGSSESSHARAGVSVFPTLGGIRASARF